MFDPSAICKDGQDCKCFVALQQIEMLADSGREWEKVTTTEYFLGGERIINGYKVLAAKDDITKPVLADCDDHECGYYVLLRQVDNVKADDFDRKRHQVLLGRDQPMVPSGSEVLNRFAVLINPLLCGTDGQGKPLSTLQMVEECFSQNFLC